jgi:spore maturation protein CgeB/SAM-dependent methyltransferase
VAIADFQKGNRGTLMHDDKNNDAANGAGEPWPDRVNDAYFDKMGSQFGEKTRSRINWMASMATGRRVLDVGCSQGITSLLLAREGFSVLGIDISERAISDAKEARAAETPGVRQRLEFRCVEACALQQEQFDTVVMGEVIEHQTNPARFIREAVRFVAPNGRIVITVPFGLHPWPDHKSTVFPSHLLDGVGEDFSCVVMEVADGYVRFVADRKRTSRGLDAATTALQATEAGAVDAQKSYYELNARNQAEAKARKEAESRLVSIEKELNALKAEKAKLELELAVSKEAYAAHATHFSEHGAFDKLRTGIIELEIKRHALEARIAEADRQAVEARSKSSLIEKEKQGLEEKTNTMASELRQALASREEFERENKALLERMADFERDLERANAKARMEADRVREAQDARRVLEAKQSHVQEKLKELTGELVVAQRKRSGHYAHLELERAKNKELVAVAARLHEDNFRYQNSLALALGRALLALGSVRGLVRFPFALYEAFRSFRRRHGGEIVVPAFVPPDVKPAAGVTPIAGKEETPQVAGSMEAAHRLSALGWEHTPIPGKVRVMSIMDEFSRACFSPHADFIEPRPDNWEALLDATRPKFVFVESTWKGNYGTWQYRVANYANPPGRELAAMVAGAKRRGIPTIFWNKEDPVHFSNFVDSASLFDIVLTTAEEAIPKYEERTAARIAVLQFAAEESIHNPVGSGGRNNKVCFAGSYYSNRFVERRDDQLMLLDAASRFDLDIYDRNYDPGNSAGSDFAFPERFSNYIRGRMPYKEMGRAYREYRVFLNVNSVIDSPTMFSRRVFELLACGTPVISTWCKGIEETFGNDLVWQVRDKEEAEYALSVLMTDDVEWKRRSLAGIRAVMSRHTFRHRFAQLLDLTGQQTEPATGESVLLVGVVNTQEDAEAVLANFRRQQLSEGVEAQLLLLGSSTVNIDAGRNIELAHGRSSELEEALRRAAVRHAAVGFLSPKAVYGQEHVQDALLAMRYSGRGIVGQPTVPSDAYSLDVALDGVSTFFSNSCMETAIEFASRLLNNDSDTDINGRGTYAAAAGVVGKANVVVMPDAQQHSFAVNHR